MRGRFPHGPPHDLGFHKWLFTIGVLAVLFSFRRRHLPAGMLMGIACLLCAPSWFLLDFLRVGDPRYLGLTPGQYFSVALLVAGIVLLFTLTRQTRAALGPSKIFPLK